MDVPLSSLMSNSAGLKTISYVDDVENISSLEALPAKDSSTARISIERRQRVRQLFNNLVCCFTRGEKNNGRKTVPKPTNHNHQASHHSTSKVSEKLLLPPVLPVNLNKKCLIVDLDETLVHSSFKAVRNPDFIIPVEIEGVVHQVYVLKRPHVDEFLQRIGKLYECILFTASLAKYADPVADLLDRNRIFQTRLFRESCVFHKGNYVKDLERLGRDLKRVVIIDNSPASYAFHPENAVAVRSWFDDMNDRELLDIVPYLEKLASVDDVYSILKNPSLARPVPRPLASPLNVNIVAQSGTSPVVNVINNININIISSVPKEYGIAPSSDQSYVKNHCSAVENCPTATTNVLAANNVSSIQSSDDAIVPNHHHHHHHHHHNHNHNHNHSSMPMTDNVLRQKNTLFNTSTSPPVKLTTSFVNDAGTPNNRLTVSTTTPQVDSVCDDTDKRSRHS